jgi:hypothetical protein
VALRAAVVTGVVAGVVVLPGLLPALGAAGEAPLRHSAKAADENSASPEDYLIPNPLHPLWGRPAMEAHAQQNIIEDALYPGLIAVVLAGIALGLLYVVAAGQGKMLSFDHVYPTIVPKS